MEQISEKNFKELFSNLCCSKCKNDFAKDSITIEQRNGNILICNLTCQKCGKDFGYIVFHHKKSNKTATPLEIVEGPDPISFDDVIDAHNFIKKNL